MAWLVHPRAELQYGTPPTGKFNESWIFPSYNPHPCCHSSVWGCSGSLWWLKSGFDDMSDTHSKRLINHIRSGHHPHCCSFVPTGSLNLSWESREARSVMKDLTQDTTGAYRLWVSQCSSVAPYTRQKCCTVIQPQCWWRYDYCLRMAVTRSIVGSLCRKCLWIKVSY